MKKQLISITVCLLLLLPLASAAHLSGKEYPRPDVSFTVVSSSGTTVNERQFYAPNQMTIIASSLGSSNVAAAIVTNTGSYPPAVEYLFQTCYAQGVLDVVYKNNDEKQFLILYCPHTWHKKTLRLAPYTGNAVKHSDVQYNYPYLTSTTTEQPTSPDLAPLSIFNFCLNDEKEIIDITSNDLDGNVGGLLSVQKYDDGIIRSFTVWYMNGKEVLRYSVDGVNENGKVTITNNGTGKTTLLPTMTCDAAQLGTYSYTFSEKMTSGDIVGPQLPGYSLTPREQGRENEPALLLIDKDWRRAQPVETANGGTLCGKNFDRENLYLQMDGSEDLFKVVRIGDKIAKDGSHLVGYRKESKDAQQPVRFLEVYCGQPLITTTTIPTTSTTTPAQATSPTAPSQCGTKTSIEQKTKPCKVGEKCNIQFTFDKGSSVGINYCVIGFFENGKVIQDDKGNPLRWIIKCDNLNKNAWTITVPANVTSMKAILYPFRANAIANHIAAKEATQANVDKPEGFQTLLFTSNAEQCTPGYGGASAGITIEEVKVEQNPLGTNLSTINLSKQPIVTPIKEGDKETGFVLVKVTNEVQKYQAGPTLDQFFSEQGRLFNNYPVAEYEQWYYVNGKKALPQSQFAEVKNYDIYCFRPAAAPTNLSGSLRETGAQNGDYDHSLGKCGAYLFFPKGNPGSVTVYKRTSTTNEAILSLDVNGATRVMTQHLRAGEDRALLAYGFWTTTIPQIGKPITVALTYPPGRDIPTAACAAGSIHLLSADFRESAQLAINDEVQPTRAFLEAGDFAYCSAVAGIALFPNKALAYVKGNSFISPTTLKTTIVEPAFIKLAFSPTATAPFRIIGESSKGITTQRFTADRIVLGDEIFSSSITLTEPKNEFERIYTTMHDDRQISSFKANYAKEKKWTVKLLSTPTKYTEKFTLNSESIDGNLVIDFDSYAGSKGHGPYHRVTVTPKKAQSNNTNVAGKAGETGSSSGAAYDITSSKPEVSPEIQYIEDQEKEPREVLKQERVIAVYETDMALRPLRSATFEEYQDVVVETDDAIKMRWLKQDAESLGRVMKFAKGGEIDWEAEVIDIKLLEPGKVLLVLKHELPECPTPCKNCIENNLLAGLYSTRKAAFNNCLLTDCLGVDPESCI